MPFPVDTLQGVFDDVTPDVTIPMPGYAVNDVVIIRLSQDTGNTVIANVDSAWVLVQSSQAQVRAQRYVEFYKVMTSTVDKETTFTGQNESWAWSVTAYRDVDNTNPIHAKTRAEFNASGSHSSPTITTMIDDCLICYSWGTDSANFMRPQNPADLNYTSAQEAVSNAFISGYLQQQGQGLTQVVTIDHESTSEGGECHVVALTPAAGATSKPVEVDSLFDVAVPYGNVETVLTATDPSIVLASSIGGISVLSTSFAFVPTDFPVPDDKMKASKITINTSSVGGWAGSLHTLNNTLDFTNKNASVEFLLTNFKSNRVGKEGAIAVFIDSAGNWTAIQLSGLSNVTSIVEVRHFDLSSADYYDQSVVAPDVSDINRIAWLAHRVNSTTNNSVITFRNLILKDSAVLKGGSADDSISPAMFERAVGGWGFVDQATNQGSGQSVGAMGIQWGNGIDATYVDTTATAFQPKLNTTRNTLPSLSQPQVIFASDACTMKFKGVMVATPEQEFKFNALSSSLAAYDFGGGNFVGWQFSGLAGIAIAGAIFTDCTVDQNFGTFDKCSFNNSPFSIENIDNVTSCDFDNNSTVDLTVAGTYTLDGNTIDSITNSSLGNITLNASNGASVINNIGPNITINNAKVLTLSGLIPGSDVVILQAGTDIVLDSVDQEPTSVWAYAYTLVQDIDIGIIKPGYVTQYIYLFSLSAFDAELPIKQLIDRSYQ